MSGGDDSQAATREAEARVDWAAIERRIERASHPAARALGMAVLAAAWMGGMVWLSTPPALREDRLLRTLPAMGLLVVLVAYVAAYASRRLVALADRGELLETCRHLVAADLAWARRMQWATGAIVAFLLYKAHFGAPVPFDRVIYYGGLALPLAAVWLHLRRVRIPAAAREARDLGLPGEARR